MRFIHCGACDAGQLTISYVNGCLCPCHCSVRSRRLSWQERAELLRRLHEKHEERVGSQHGQGP